MRACACFAARLPLPFREEVGEGVCGRCCIAIASVKAASVNKPTPPPLPPRVVRSRFKDLGSAISGGDKGKRTTLLYLDKI